MSGNGVEIENIRFMQEQRQDGEKPAGGGNGGRHGRDDDGPRFVRCDLFVTCCEQQFAFVLAASNFLASWCYESLGSAGLDEFSGFDLDFNFESPSSRRARAASIGCTGPFHFGANFVTLHGSVVGAAKCSLRIGFELACRHRFPGAYLW